MEIGNEISQKIRSAIKAKLVDLGVYVDDELPDYIMVMVANKKTQDQMTEDLNLFLGNNTEKFTSWLHGLLKKLQSITADPKPEEQSTVQRVDDIDEGEAELQIRPDHDDFEEESKGEAAAPVKSKTIAVVPSTLKPSSRVRPLESRSSRSEVSTSRNVSISREEFKPKSSSDPSHTEAPLQKQRAAIRKRRAPESVVGSVVSHVVEEEEYDPRRPLIGRVASTVSVGRRKPSVPPSKQANSSLILKAMNEARDSVVSKSSSREVAYEAPKPRYGPRSRTDARGSLRSSGSSQRVTRVASDDPMSADFDERSVQLYSRSKREEVLQQLRAGLHSDSEDLDNAAYHAEDNRYISAGGGEIEEETERRTITVEPKKQPQPVEEEEDDVERLDLLIESGAEQSDFTDEETETRIVQKPAPPEPAEERPASPKFVVTLDGVDPSSLVRHDTDEETDMQTDEDLPKAVGRVAPQRIRTSTPLETSIDMDMEFIESEPGESPPKRVRLPEKCKFWMNCRNGDQCPYHHPKFPCKMFPKCKFGDKCNYVHPNCKFDAHCTKPNCPFTHRAKQRSFPTPTALPVVIQPFNVVPSVEQFSQQYNMAAGGVTPHLPPKQMKCKFFPNCTNMSCPFIHPKVCRYGIGCSNKATCAFSHPEPPPVEKLKWTAPRLESQK